MDVNIGEVHSTLRTSDGAALLSPELLQRIVAAVLERLQDEDLRQQRAREERQLDDRDAQER